ncbi:hypothetical protein DID88_009778 [Monilinia fructigena]|uniref:Uncharacterized protein n=1 Tax=Monilinia fructigena TaxID=38457 RepID=A0A395IMH8_9HELO|nr:hypothetical protein DID88_009778 [Monilinia fructigena]
MAQFGVSKEMDQSGMPYYFAEALLLLIGVVCFTKRWPESWMPGSFDLLGNSHQNISSFGYIGFGFTFGGTLTGV